MSKDRKAIKVKKILIIGMTNIMGGVETFIYNTVMNSDKKKFKYDFLVHGYKECIYQKEIEDFYDGKVSFYFIPQYKKNPLKCIRALVRFYNKYGNEYDIIHLQTGATSEVFYVYPFVKKTKAMVIIHSHIGAGNHLFENAIARLFVNYIVDKRLACSKVASHWLFGKRNEKTTKIIMNGIDNERFRYSEKARAKIREKYGISDDNFVVGHVGRFSFQKNHFFIIDIFIEILKVDETAQLILVGVGENEDRIKNICQERNLLSSIHFVGNQKNTEDFYSAFDVFLMPSLYEGLPLVGVEAQASGLPCFFSENIDLQILISDRAEMYSLTMKASEWAERILKVRYVNKDRKLYSDIIHEKGYSIRKTVEELEDIYEV